MGKHTGNHAASAYSQWDIVYASILTLAATLVLQAAGCVYKPYIIGLKPESPVNEKESQVDQLRPIFDGNDSPGPRILKSSALMVLNELLP